MNIAELERITLKEEWVAGRELSRKRCPIFGIGKGGLSVSFEARFPKDSELSFSGLDDFPEKFDPWEYIHNSDHVNYKKVYYPALVEGRFKEKLDRIGKISKIFSSSCDMKEKNNIKGVMTFLPFVDETKIPSERHSIVFWLKLDGRKQMPWIRMARLNEKSNFEFRYPSARMDMSFISLDFLTKTKGFEPVFVKALSDQEYIYFVVELDPQSFSSDGESLTSIGLRVRKVTEAEAPIHLSMVVKV
ncbi:MAG: hypothetical protein Q8Q06_04550 [bacterium]|nr:hypothetical protein [bacterium]